MIRVRLRDYPDPAELARMYAQPHDHSRFADHRYRVDMTIALARCFVTANVWTVADLSCGNAAIARELQSWHGVDLTLGDYAPGYEHHGPIEKTIHEIDPVDMFICSETIEHLADPDAVLRDIRTKTGLLVLSTPDGETGHTNPEHIWGWDSEAVGDMLRQAGFEPKICNTLDLRPMGYLYSFQIWVAS